MILILGNFNGVKIRHIHPLASILSHECSPNLKKYYTGISQGSNLQCKAAIDIKCGQKLTVSYIDLLLPTMIRQKLLREVSNAWYRTNQNFFFKFFDFLRNIFLSANAVDVKILLI